MRTELEAGGWRLEAGQGQNLVLVGFMGCGKTTVGRILAARLGFAFADTDDFVVEAAGQSVPDIFAEHGEAYFRALERAAVTRAAALRGAVIATGGGVLKDAGNARALRASGAVVYLRVSPAQILRNLEGDDTRPLLRTADKAATAARLLAEREPLYLAAADAAVETDGLTPEQAADRVYEQYHSLLR